MIYYSLVLINDRLNLMRVLGPYESQLQAIQDITPTLAQTDDADDWTSHVCPVELPSFIEGMDS